MKVQLLLLVVFAFAAVLASTERTYSRKTNNEQFNTLNAVHLRAMSRSPSTDLWFYNCTIELPTLEGDYVAAFNEGHWRRKTFVEKSSSFMDTRAYYRSSSEHLAFEQVATLLTGKVDADARSFEVKWTTPHVAESRLAMYLNIEAHAYGSDLLYTVFTGEKSRRAIIAEQLQTMVAHERHFLSTTFLDDPVGVFLPIRTRCDCQVIGEDDQPAAVRAGFFAFENRRVPMVSDNENSEELVYLYEFPGTHDEEQEDLFYKDTSTTNMHWADYFGH